jgi:3-oxoacyl-[acyl-carrier-protein] synthase II
MTRMAIKGIGVTGGFGCGVSELAAALETGIGRVGELTVPTAQGPRQLPAFRAQTGRLEEFLPKRTLRRVDHYSRMALLGAHLALADAGMLGSDLSRLGVVVASGYGATATTFAFLDSIIDDGDLCASPTHFANSLHNVAAANISILLGAKGPSLTVSQFEMSVGSALLSARQWLAEGRVDSLLFGAVDEVSELVGYLQHRKRGPLPSAAASPLNFQVESSIVGEGAAFLLLTREDEGPAYCGIDAVQTGTLRPGEFSLDAGAFLLLGADGRRELGARYRELLPEASRVACYAPVYGSMPAGAAFDLAAAALILQRGLAYANAGAAGCDLLGNPVPLETSRICSLRLSDAGEYAAITLSSRSINQKRS